LFVDLNCNSICDLVVANKIPTAIWNLILSKRSEDSHSGLAKLLAEEEKEGFPMPKDKDRWWETVRINQT